MPQTWLHSNRRAITAGFVVPIVMAIAGLILALWPFQAWWWRMLAIFPFTIAAMTTWSLWRLLRQPRLAYENGHLLVYLSGSFVPQRLPIDVVECFFMGQAPSLLPTSTQAPQTRSHSIVIRLAEAAAEWHHRPVRPQLGQWCDGYITIRGTWSEPIQPSLVQELNQRLVDAHRQQRQQEEGRTS